MAQQRIKAPPKLTSEIDKAQLLILGLNLLNKGLNVPCAVVQPQAKSTTSSPMLSSGPSSPSGSSTSSVPNSPRKVPVLPLALNDASRKRKRDQGADVSEVEKREKR